MLKPEYRMYGLVPYNLSPIQQGIQFGHGVVEYAQDNFNDPVYQHWASKYKTFMILNGGTSNHSENRYEKDVPYVGTMEMHLKALQDAGVKIGVFYEPDLNDMLSAIVFLVEERAFDKETYPEKRLGITATEEDKKAAENELIDLIGQDNFFLRRFISQFRLA